MRGATLIALATLLGTAVVYLLGVDADRSRPATDGVLRPAEARAAESPARSQVQLDRPEERLAAEPRATPREIDVQGTSSRAPVPDLGPRVRVLINGAVLSRQGPIPGAQLIAFAGQRPVLEEQSDDQGRFSLLFERPLENATVRVQARGFAPLEIPIEVPDRSGSQLLGNLILQEGVRLSGKVHLPDGSPAPGATLTLRSLASGRGANLHAQEAETKADGSFHFPQAPRGQIQVSARASGFGEASRQLNLTNSTSVDLHLQVARSLILRLVDPTGEAVPDVSVRLLSAQHGGQAREMDTDRTGRARFSDLGESHWNVQVTSPEHRPLAQPGIAANGDEVELVLQPWPCIVGRVLLPGGDPAPEGTLVEILPSSRRGDLVRVQVQPPSHPTDPQGRYRACGVRPGTYVLRARAPGFAPSDSKPFQVGPKEETFAAPVFLERGGGLAFDVTDGRSALKGSQVEIYASPPPAALIWLPEASRVRAPLAEGTADRDGHVEIEGLASGQAWALVRAEGCLPHLLGPLVVSTGGVHEVGKVTLEKGSRIFGQVNDELGHGVTGALVMLLANDQVPTTIHLTTDADGNYSSPPVPGGDWHLRVRTASGTRGSQTQTLKAQVPHGGDARVDFQL